MSMHLFDTKIAQAYGLDEAILLQNIAFWTEKNRANNHNEFDGLHWLYNSMNAWSELFPYMSVNRIRGALKTLEDKGLIKSGNYNENKYDRTKWYALSESGLSICEFSTMEKQESTNRTNDINEPIPVINTVVITDTKKQAKKDLAFDFDGFDKQKSEAIEEWLEYKKEIGKSYKSQKSLDGLRKELLTNQNLVRDIAWSISRGYQGIYSPDGNKAQAKPSAHNLKNQDYSRAEEILGVAVNQEARW